MKINHLILTFFLARSCFGMVNGTISPVWDPIPFKNTVALRIPGDNNAFCTGSKVAAHTFLTAAHCVFDPNTRNIRTIFAAGRGIEYTNLANPGLVSLPVGPYFTATIDAVYVNPAFYGACTAPGCNMAVVSESAADVAVIRLREEPLFGVFPAYLDFSNVGSANKVVLGGHGCEHGNLGTLSQRYPAGYSRLSYGNNIVMDVAAIASAGFGRPSDTHLFYTPGMPLDRTLPSVCQGDSGGPIYRDDGTRNNIVGVNSAISFWDSSQLGVINRHARISTVETWLRSVLY